MASSSGYAYRAASHHRSMERARDSRQGALPLVLVAVFTADSGPSWTGWFIAALLYNAVLASAVAMLLWFYALRHLPAGTAGLGRLLAPVVGVGASWIQLGDRPDCYEAIGMALILLGLAALATSPPATSHHLRWMTPPRSSLLRVQRAISRTSKARSVRRVVEVCPPRCARR